MKQTPLTPSLYDYMLNVSLREHPVLTELRHATAYLRLSHMQIAPEQAQFMQFLIQLIGAKHVLELGTFTGYSALAMALAIPHDGKLITCDINPEWTQHAIPFWQQAGMSEKIELRIAPARASLEVLIAAQQRFDFIFIDADKTNYVHYYECALKLITPNGLIMIDNVFWDGQVVDANDNRAQTREIRKLNALIQHDARVTTSLLPIADGVFLIRPCSTHQQ